MTLLEAITLAAAAGRDETAWFARVLDRTDEEFGFVLVGVRPDGTLVDSEFDDRGENHAIDPEDVGGLDAGGWRGFNAGLVVTHGAAGIVAATLILRGEDRGETPTVDEALIAAGDIIARARTC